MKTFMLWMTVLAAPVMAADALVGEYAAQAQEIASGLVLHADQSFQYFFTYGAADYTAKGTWRREKDAVLLTSSLMEAKPFRVIRTAKGEPGMARVHVVGPNGKGVQHMDVTVATAEGPVTERTSQEGVAEFEVKGALKTVSVHVPVYDVEAGPFEVAPGNNDIWMEINGEAITNLQFRDERLMVVKGSLVMTYWKGEQPLRYKKQ